MFQALFIGCGILTGCTATSDVVTPGVFRHEDWVSIPCNLGKAFPGIKAANKPAIAPFPAVMSGQDTFTFFPTHERHDNPKKVMQYIYKLVTLRVENPEWKRIQEAKKEAESRRKKALAEMQAKIKADEDVRDIFKFLELGVGGSTEEQTIIDAYTIYIREMKKWKRKEENLASKLRNGDRHTFVENNLPIVQIKRNDPRQGEIRWERYFPRKNTNQKEIGEIRDMIYKANDDGRDLHEKDSKIMWVLGEQYRTIPQTLADYIRRDIYRTTNRELKCGTTQDETGAQMLADAVQTGKYGMGKHFKEFQC